MPSVSIPPIPSTRSHDKSETKSRPFITLLAYFFSTNYPCYQHLITAYFPLMFSIQKIFLSFSKKPVKPVEPVRYRHRHDPNARPLKPIIKLPITTRENTQVSFAEEGYVRDPYTRTPYNTSVRRDEEPFARDPFQPPNAKTPAYPGATSGERFPYSFLHSMERNHAFLCRSSFEL